MRCPNCGDEYSDELEFCPNCNTRNSKSSSGDGIKLDKKKVGIILAAVAVAVVLIGSFQFIQSKKNPKQFIEYVQTGRYGKADEIFNSSISLHDRQDQEAYALAEQDLESKVEAYYAGTATYEEVTELLEQYSKYYEELKEKYASQIETLHTSQKNFQTAEEYWNLGEYTSAYQSYEKVIEEDINYEEAQKKLEECQNKAAETALADADEFAKEEKYLDAIRQLQNGLNTGILTEEKEAEIEEKISEYEEKRAELVLKDVDSYVASGEYEQALEMLRKDTYANKDAFQKKKGEVAELYENSVKESVASLLEERNLEDARVTVKNAQMVLPDSELFAELEEEVTEYYPVKLQDIYLFDSNVPGTKNYEQNPKDTYQNQYGEGFVYYGTDSGSSTVSLEHGETYLLNKDYVRFTAVVAASEKWGSRHRAKAARIAIYGDGIELFSITVDKNTKPAEVNIDVTGVEKLEIGFLEGWEAYLLIADPLLYKRY